MNVPSAAQRSRKEILPDIRVYFTVDLGPLEATATGGGSDAGNAQRTACSRPKRVEMSRIGRLYEVNKDQQYSNDARIGIIPALARG